MPTISSDTGNVSRLNCGLWRDRGTVRTSTTRVEQSAFFWRMNSSFDRVECPTVSTVSGDSDVRFQTWKRPVALSLRYGNLRNLVAPRSVGMGPSEGNDDLPSTTA